MKREHSKGAGRTFAGREPISITAERIAGFCAALGETNPLYVDPVAAAAGPYGGIVAPPALVAAFRYADDVFEQLPAFARGGLMSGIDIEFETPVRPGDTIHVTSELGDSYEKTGRTGNMIFAIVHSTLTNQHRQVVARVTYRMMNRPR